MKVVVWLTEATWPACVAALRDLAPRDADVTLLYVADDGVAAAAQGALAGLLGRRSGPSGGDPATRLGALATQAGRDLLTTAAHAAGRPVTVDQRHGRVEREVVHAADGADLLVLARDGDLRRLGPHSLGPATRFVVDHAPCATLLVWPETAPEIGSIPPPPDHPPR
ncbi:MAG: universal stress protein [Cellulomonas sp.]